MSLSNGEPVWSGDVAPPRPTLRRTREWDDDDILDIELVPRPRSSRRRNPPFRLPPKGMYGTVGSGWGSTNEERAAYCRRAYARAYSRARRDEEPVRAEVSPSTYRAERYVPPPPPEHDGHYRAWFVDVPEPA